jgi:ribosomal protein S18 acetylase RimI-like enzyme
MSAGTLSSKSVPGHGQTGVRRIHIRHDLYFVADLLEIAFGPTLDNNGRAMIREMRMWSQTGPLLWVLAGLDRMLQGLMMGYVWVDGPQDRVVGNVSMYPAGYNETWVIANVAVHPEYRQRGIASALMETALEDLVKRKAHKAILQVDEDNAVARRLYEHLGFRTLRGFTRWRRRPWQPAPRSVEDMPRISLRQRHDWKAQWHLAEQIRPNSRGGMGWLKPTRQAEFKRTLSQKLGMGNLTQWVVRDSATQQLAATLRADIAFGKPYARVDLLIAPTWQGVYERPLLNYIVRYLVERGKGCMIQHPSDDDFVNQVLHEYDFETTHRLVHMELAL